MASIAIFMMKSGRNADWSKLGSRFRPVWILQLLHVDCHRSLVEAAISADAVRHLGLVAAGTDGQVRHVNVVVRTAVLAPRVRQFSLWIGHSGLPWGVDFRQSPCGIQVKVRKPALEG